MALRYAGHTYVLARDMDLGNVHALCVCGGDGRCVQLTLGI